MLLVRVGLWVGVCGWCVGLVCEVGVWDSQSVRVLVVSLPSKDRSPGVTTKTHQREKTTTGKADPCDQIARGAHGRGGESVVNLFTLIRPSPNPQF